MFTDHLLPRLLAGALMAPALLISQSPRVDQMETAANAIDSAEIARHAHFLASDELRGRSTLEPGFDSAAAYVARHLASLGVTPAGDTGGWFQHFTVISARLDTSRAAGAIDGAAVRYGDDFVVQSFLNGGRFEGEVVSVGHGYRMPDLDIDPYGEIDVAGKWLLVDGRTPLPPRVERSELGVSGVDHFNVNDEAVRRGALGILTIPGDGQVRGWNSFRNRVPIGRDLNPSQGRAYAAYPLPRIMLSSDVALGLLERLPGVSVRVAIDLVAESTTYRPYNVVGFVEGADPELRDQWISIASHLDGAVGRSVTESGDSIYNAADDNASGSAVDMAVVRAIMAGPRPARSILFIWDSGEEIGLWGSRHMAYNASGKIVAHFNIDMLGRTRQPGSDDPTEAELAGPGEVWVSGPPLMSSMMSRVLDRVRREYDWVRLTPRHDDPTVSFFYPRTDAAPYMENGIPVIQFMTGLHADYHRQTDESSRLDIAKMTGAARMIYATLWLMADDPERPSWDKPVPAQLPFVTPRR